MVLSRRVADATNLLRMLQGDNKIINTIVTQPVNMDNLKQLVHYVSSHYSCSATDAEEALHHLIRQRGQNRQSTLTSRKAADHIVIPPTADNPVGKKVPLKPKPADGTSGDQAATIDPTPANTEQQKVEDLTKSATDDQSNRQQQLINSIKALKVVANDLARSMYGVELTEENQGKVCSKAIEAIANLSAVQTSITVKSLASPLIGDQ